jgi:hypothetical protein
MYCEVVRTRQKSLQPGGIRFRRLADLPQTGDLEWFKCARSVDVNDRVELLTWAHMVVVALSFVKPINRESSPYRSANAPRRAAKADGETSIRSGTSGPSCAADQQRIVSS